MKSIIIILFACAITSQTAPADERIVGGHVISIEEVPYQVYLQAGSSICGGSIISNEWVLTAAHCVEFAKNEHNQIRAGSSFNYKGGEVVEVNEIIMHPKWNRDTTDYDYALLKLSKTLDMNNKTIKSVNLPQQNEELEVDTKCLVSGWGNTQNPSESRDELRGVEVPVVDRLECREAYDDKLVTERMICAGLKQGGKDSCQGDSGGPFVYNNTLYGVVSWGKGCALPDFPGVYSNVAYVRDWIKAETNL